MSFKLGNTNIGELYVGSTKIAQAYLGSTLVFQASTPTPTFDEVTIGTQTWMAKNLAIDDGGGGIIVIDNVTVNGINFGKQYYYNWEAVQRIVNSLIGWRLPTVEEWRNLTNTYSSNYCADLRSTTGWNKSRPGTNATGLNVLPVGYHNGSSLTSTGNTGAFWCSTKYAMTIGVYGGEVQSGGSYYYSVRLIKI